MPQPLRVNSTEIDPKYQNRIVREGNVIKIDACDIYYKDLNCLLRAIIQSEGLEKIELQNICGQRYLGTDLNTKIQIDIYGTTGNDLGAFMNGPKVEVYGNCLLYTSDAADEEDSVDLGGRRIIKKKKK